MEGPTYDDIVTAIGKEFYAYCLGCNFGIEYKPPGCGGHYAEQHPGRDKLVACSAGGCRICGLYHNIQKVLIPLFQPGLPEDPGKINWDDELKKLHGQ